MSDFNTKLQQVASATILADVNDPPTILHLHDDLRALRDAMPASKQMEIDAAHSAEQLLQRIILLEEADPKAALAQVLSSINNIHESLEAGDSETTVNDSASENNSTFRSDDLPLIRDFITESREHLELAEAEVLKLESGTDPEAVNAIFRSFHTIKGVAGFLNLADIGHLAHSAENLLDLARQGKLNIDAAATELILQSIDAAKSMIAAIEVAVSSNAPLAAYEGLKELQTRLADCAAGKTSAATKTTKAMAPTAPAHAEAPTTSGPAKTDGTVKVATTRLDSLINMVGELVITQSMVRQGIRKMDGGDPGLARNIARLDKITRELQDISMSMRMVPIQGTFQKMTRLVRDLASKFGKQIELTITGGDTELDRNVVEAIADPLVHMVRNSADHGIESPEQREKSGKSPTGHVELKAYHLAGQVVIEIRDDGKGLSKQRILKKAIDAGIVKPNETLADAEIHRLIFHAGLSTAEKVTDVSGRGVGMDVVKRNIEALRGQVDITSVEGQGSTFTIRLPLTLAVIDGLVVRIGQQRFIIPILSVEQSLRPDASQISSVHGKGEICMVRGRPLRVLRLHELFDVDKCVQDPTKGLIVIARDNGREACLLVDELVGQQQVVIKSLGVDFANTRGFAGGAILGDGAVSLIIDVPGVIDLASSSAKREAA